MPSLIPGETIPSRGPSKEGYEDEAPLTRSRGEAEGTQRGGEGGAEVDLVPVGRDEHRAALAVERVTAERRARPHSFLPRTAIETLRQKS